MTTYRSNDATAFDGIVSVTITSKALKKGKPVMITLDAVRCQIPALYDPMEKTFILRQTSRDLQRRRFTLEPGCTITDSTDRFECTSIAFTNRPKYPILTAKLCK